MRERVLGFGESVRRLAFPLILALDIAAPMLHAQCAGTRASNPGAILIAQARNETITAPGRGKQAYNKYPLDLSAFYPAGGVLTIEASLGRGPSAASFDLFPNEASVPTSGTPDKALRIQAQPRQYDVAPGTCVTLTYPFAQLYHVVFAATGNWESPFGSTNTLQFSAFVTRPAPPEKPRPGSVTIYDSPAVPDLGGHTIITPLVIGVLTGKGLTPALTAILPKLKVCVTPKGAGEDKRVCTEVCKPGHQCLNQPFIGVSPHATTLTAEIFDVDRPGSEHNIVTKDINPANCNNQCEIKVPDEATYGKGAVVKIGFNLGPEYICTADYGPLGPRGGPVTFDGGTILNKQHTDLVQVRAPVTVTGRDIQTGVVHSIANSGVTVTVRSPRAKFYQFLSRERIGTDGKAMTGNVIQYSQNIKYAVGDSVVVNEKLYTMLKPGSLAPDASSAAANAIWEPNSAQNCNAKPPGGFCYNLNDPKGVINWRWDGAAEYAPSYNPNDIVYGCDGTTLYDTPYLLAGSGPETWRFTGRDYIVVGYDVVDQPIVVRVEWVKEKGPNEVHDRYTKATVEIDTAAGTLLNELKSLLKSNRKPTTGIP